MGTGCDALVVAGFARIQHRTVIRLNSCEFSYHHKSPGWPGLDRREAPAIAGAREENPLTSNVHPHRGFAPAVAPTPAVRRRSPAVEDFITGSLFSARTSVAGGRDSCRAAEPVECPIQQRLGGSLAFPSCLRRINRSRTTSPKPTALPSHAACQCFRGASPTAGNQPAPVDGGAVGIRIIAGATIPAILSTR